MFKKALVNDMPATPGSPGLRGDRPLVIRMEQDGADIGVFVLRQQLAISVLQIDFEQRAFVAPPGVDQESRRPVRTRREPGRLAIFERDFGEGRPRAVFLALQDLVRPVGQRTLGKAQVKGVVGVQTEELAVLEHQS